MILRQLIFCLIPLTPTLPRAGGREKPSSVSVGEECLPAFPSNFSCFRAPFGFLPPRGAGEGGVRGIFLRNPLILRSWRRQAFEDILDISAGGGESDSRLKGGG